MHLPHSLLQLTPLDPRRDPRDRTVDQPDAPRQDLTEALADSLTARQGIALLLAALEVTDIPEKDKVRGTSALLGSLTTENPTQKESALPRPTLHLTVSRFLNALTRPTRLRK
jgi:hypothetical protein